MLKKKLVALVLAALTMLFVVGCGGEEEELGMDPESMAVAYMKAYAESDPTAIIKAVNLDAVRDVLEDWYADRNDGKKYPEYMWEEYYDMVVQDIEDDCDEQRDQLQEMYGDDCSVECKAIDVRRMSSDEIKEYKHYFVKSGSFDLDNGKMVTVEMPISGGEDSFSGTVEVPVIKYNDQWIIAIPELK